MKIQYIKGILIALVIAVSAVPALSMAQEFSIGGGNATGADSNGAANVSGGSALSVGGNNTIGADSNGAPSTAPSGGSPALSVGGNNSTGADATAPSNPPSNPGNISTGANISSGSGFVGGQGGSIFLTNATTSTSTLPVLINMGQCEYLGSYLKIGGNNPANEVNKLQTFLRDVEKLDVTVTGFFDTQTFEGVKAFQAKYLNEIMRPWGASIPSGQVYFTTRKKINEVYCKTNFSLTAAQIAEIERYRTNRLAGTNTETGINLGNTSVDAITSTTTIELDGDVGSAETVKGDSQTASSGNLSFWGKIWKFIKGIFGR